MLTKLIHRKVLSVKVLARFRAVRKKEYRARCGLIGWDRESLFIDRPSPFKLHMRLGREATTEIHGGAAILDS